MTYQLHHLGVDRLMMRSEKTYAGGTVVMLVRFDRLQPAADTFIVELHDRTGRTVRTERYGTDEVIERARRLSHWAATQPVNDEEGPTTAPSGTTRPAGSRDMREGLMQRVIAATQPAAK